MKKSLGREKDLRDIKLIKAALETGETERKYYEAYDERYKTAHEQGIRWFGDISSPIVTEIISRYHISKDKKILEIGCGEGRDAEGLLKAGFCVLATDISPKAIEYCKTMLPAYKEVFQILDCVKDSLAETFDFIYAVAVVHMLVQDEDRNAFYRFIFNHLTADGAALICSMGDGNMEFQSDISTAFDLQERTHNGKTVLVAGTSCRVVNKETFEKELKENHLEIVEQGTTCIPEQFPEMLYAVVKRKQ
ncbi:MAG: class I SAM-dependent methyltransferase [Lachnospiraceae bacterium]|nr:class I SAM-dependent methyltransferase [Lachnospiraceae bacterium]